MCSSIIFFLYHRLPFLVVMNVRSFRPSKYRLLNKFDRDRFCVSSLFFRRDRLTLFRSTTLNESSFDTITKSCKTADSLEAAALSEMPRRSQALATVGRYFRCLRFLLSFSCTFANGRSSSLSLPDSIGT